MKNLRALFRQQKVSGLFLIYSTGIALLAVVLVAGLFAWLEFRRFSAEEQRVREQYIGQQKDLVKRETLKVVDYINFTRMFLEERMKDDLRNKVAQAWLLMDNLYRQNHRKYSDQQIKDLIRDALRPVRYNHGRGYLFIVSMDGTEELFPVAPWLEGKNLLDLQDEKGNFVIQDEIKLIRKSDSGFVTDYWTKPGDQSGMIYPKTSYVKYFKPLDWYIGCGEYLDNVEKDMQREAIIRIQQSRFGTDGYVFANTFDGYAIVIDSEKYKAGDYIWELEDADGFKIIQKEVDVARQPDGGFISYKWKKPNSAEVAPKLSYFKSIDDWGWVIGAGVYTEEIDKQIAADRVSHRIDLARALTLSIIAFFAVVVIVYTVGRRISRMIEHNFRRFINDLTQAVDKDTMLVAETYSLTELKTVTGNINSVIETRRLVREKLSESEIRFRTIYENVPVMIAILDQHYWAIKYNHRLADVFGFADRRPVSPDFVRAQLTKSPVNIRFARFMEVADGEFVEIEINTVMGHRSHQWAHFKSEAGQVILVGYDITELRENQQQLKAINDTKDKLFSIIAHDLRNPIGTLKMFLEELTNPDEERTPEEQNQFLGLLREMATKAFNLLENLLVWARSQRGTIEYRPGPTGLAATVNSIAELYQPAARDKGTVISLDIPPSLSLLCDPDMLHTILRNLVGNAVKFTQKGTILISARSLGSMAEISVADSGMGMPAEVADSLFNKVLMVESQPGTRGEKGSGLGLMICGEFVHRHGGTITAASVPGQGTTIRFTMPQAPDSA